MGRGTLVKYRKWNIGEADRSAVDTLRSAGYSWLLASVLAARGVTTPEAAAEKLERERALTLSPLLMKDMDRAVARIQRAIADGETVAVFGDYDVDGITATVVVEDYLRRQGVNCLRYIPRRVEDGYGLSLDAIRRLREQGAQVSFVEVDDAGRLCYDQFERLLRPNTRFVAVTHASNVTGNLTDLAFVSAFAKKHGLTLIVDAAQTAGARPIDVQALGADVLCFTGHKALLGPQGTGGLYVRPGLAVRPLVVGGSGIHSFDEAHPSQMPTALEAGTLNVPGLAGLGAGVEWLLSQGVEALHKKELALTRLFYERIVHAPGVKVYGSFAEADRAPIVSLNFGEEDAARAADILWEDYKLCVRAGAHCAPLIHKALGTAEQGMVRFSFSHQNTEAEVFEAAEAVCQLAEEL